MRMPSYKAQIVNQNMNSLLNSSLFQDFPETNVSHKARSGRKSILPARLRMAAGKRAGLKAWAMATQRRVAPSMNRKMAPPIATREKSSRMFLFKYHNRFAKQSARAAGRN